ncbi:hypothetical protein MRX96_032308 [Rhipicephalus microplus]
MPRLACRGHLARRSALWRARAEPTHRERARRRLCFRPELRDGHKIFRAAHDNDKETTPKKGGLLGCARLVRRGDTTDPAPPQKESSSTYGEALVGNTADDSRALRSRVNDDSTLCSPLGVPICAKPWIR